MSSSPSSFDSIDDAAKWLVEGAPGVKRPEELMSVLGERLLQLGLPLDHVTVFVATLHPNVIGRMFNWFPDREVEIMELQESSQPDDVYHDPNLNEVIRTRTAVRITDDLEEGYTDLFMQPLEFTNGEVHAVSWGTKREGGFEEKDLTAIEKIRAPLARIAENYALRRLAGNILSTYVGRTTGEKILSGRIHRGDVERIEAVIAFSDLRGFTRLSNELPADEVVELLNDYFDCIVGPFESFGGEILKFMGDAVLAILPVESDPETACRKALAVVPAVREAVEECNRRRKHPIRFGTGVNIGEVMYGNIGSATRLDFTTIGPAVNFAARLEGVARDLGLGVVTSAAFARHCPDATESLGMFELKGFREPAEVFGVRDQG